MRPVAPVTNLFRFPTLRLCLLTLSSLPEFKENSKPPDGKKTWFDLAVAGLKLKTLQNAYVMLLRTSVCGKSVQPVIHNGIFARSDNAGQVLRPQQLAEV